MKTMHEIREKIESKVQLINEAIEKAGKKEISVDDLVNQIKQYNAEISALEWVLNIDIYNQK